MQVPVDVAIRGTDRRFALNEGAKLTIGRTKDCDVHLDDQAVSRKHCTIEARDGALLVTDLESANGTYVNDRLVHAATAHAGDVIRIGSTELEILGGASAKVGVEPILSAEDTTMASIIRKRFNPAEFEWLATMSDSVDTGSANLGLLQRAQRHLSMLHRMSETLASVRDMTALADATLAALLDVTGADRAALVMHRAGEPAGAIEVAAAKGRTPGLQAFTVSRTLVADVIDKGVSTFAYDALHDSRFRVGASVVGQQVRSVMCVPLRTNDEIFGALYVDSLSAVGKFTEPDLELLAALGNQAGVALHRVRLMAQVEQLLLDTIRAIAATIDAKDGYTHRHSERVAALSGRLASEMGLSDDERRTVQLSALLHDVGKIAVPDSILNKPGRLTSEEFDEIKKHPTHGARILGNIQSPSITAVLPGVRHHHEKWDGSGYPDGLSGDAIPFLGRLLGVADFFDALTSSRSYRAATSADHAVGLIEQGNGSHFDPHIVEVVLRLHRRGDLLPANWLELVAAGSSFSPAAPVAERK
jgi:HD-GYP domain-containing protein (c-di-GMP phosphodiesterase class II)